MLPPGFLGTGANLLLDIVVVALAALLPALFFSWRSARAGKYPLHKRMQVTLFWVLTVAVLLFELDIRLSGGIVAMTGDSRFAGTLILSGSIWFHMALAILTASVWIWLLFTSLRRFPSPPEPGAFSPTHRRWGRIAMIGMVLTGITGIELYVIGFVF